MFSVYSSRFTITMCSFALSPGRATLVPPQWLSCPLASRRGALVRGRERKRVFPPLVLSGRAALGLSVSVTLLFFCNHAPPVLADSSVSSPGYYTL